MSGVRVGEVNIRVPLLKVEGWSRTVHTVVGWVLVSTSQILSSMSSLSESSERMETSATMNTSAVLPVVKACPWSAVKLALESLPCWTLLTRVGMGLIVPLTLIARARRATIVMNEYGGDSMRRLAWSAMDQPGAGFGSWLMDTMDHVVAQLHSATTQ